MKRSIAFVLFLAVLFSCKEEQQKPETILVPSANETADMNKTWNQEEQELIHQFIQRKGWEMKETESGLHYLIYNPGKGEKAEPGMKAMIEYSISLLDGTVLYSSKEIGPKPFHIEKDNVEQGLHEGVTYMRVGDKAKIIVPFYLAHGLMGDHAKIPPLASLVFDVRLLGLSR